MSCKIVLCFIIFIFDLPIQAYYIVEPISDRAEQSSRDLDLSFSAGDPDRSEPTHIIRPYIKKVYAYRDPENPSVELGIDRPYSYYEISEIPPRRPGWAEAFVGPERNRKLVKFNNSHKGEVILELRVTANNNDVV